MAIDNWQKVRLLVEAAALLPPDQRESFLSDEITDPQLRAEVAELLSFMGESTNVFPLQAWAEGALAPPAEADLAGLSIGNYRLLKELGRGGMGAVYLAERADGSYEHRVALKVLQEGLATPRLIERFREERQILARLSHPSIARLLDGGITADGRPYLVLEYVDGQTIDQYCETANLTLQDKLKLFIKVAEAVQSAHQQLVLHLDIKPANILVTADGEPRLLDFGISKILNDELTRQHGTDATLRLMTPRYASPEQAEGAPLGVASDIFSLATLLYRILTGRLPYPVEDASPLEAARLIRETPPTPPSEAAPPELKSALRGDLDTILLQALRKEPERRYPNVAAFAADVQLHLDSKPVQAHADSLLYRAQKFLGRNRIAAPLTAVGLLLLAISVAVSVRSAIKARRAEATAERRLLQARGLAHSYVFDLDTMLQDIPGTISVRHFVLENAQKYLEAMSTESAGDEDLAHEMAEGYVEIGRVQATPGIPSMSDWKAGAISKAKAVAIERRLLEKHPSDLKQRGLLLRELINQASIPDFLGDIDGREKIYNETWQTGQPLLAAGPVTKRYLNMSVVAWTIALLHAGNGDDWSLADPIGAVPWLDRSESIANTYQAAHPELPHDAATRGMIQRVTINRASILVQTGHPLQAKAVYQKAISLCLPVGQDALEDQVRKQLLGLYAAYLLGINDVAGAEASAPAPQASSVHEKEHDRQLTADEADELILLARIDFRRGRIAAGKQKMQQGLNTLEKLHQTLPEDANLSSQLAWDSLFLADEPNLDPATRKLRYARAIELAQWFAAQQPRALKTSMLIGKSELGLARLAQAEHRLPEQQGHAATAATHFSKVLAAYPIQPEASTLLTQAKTLTAA